MTTTQRFGTPTVAAGDLTGRLHQAATRAEKDNEAARNLAVGRIKDNDGLRYVLLPSGGTWPVPREFHQLLPDDLRK